MAAVATAVGMVVVMAVVVMGVVVKVAEARVVVRAATEGVAGRVRPVERVVERVCMTAEATRGVARGAVMQVGVVMLAGGSPAPDILSRPVPRGKLSCCFVLVATASRPYWGVVFHKALHPHTPHHPSQTLWPRTEMPYPKLSPPPHR